MRLLQNTQTRPVLGVGFGPDGRTLVAGGSGGFDVWDVAASAHTFVATAESSILWAFVLDPLGRWLYFSGNRGSILYEGVCELTTSVLLGHGHRKERLSQ